LLTLIRKLRPQWVTTTEQVGHAMIKVGMRGAPRFALENQDINSLAE
jgi:hypothetical protein